MQVLVTINYIQFSESKAKSFQASVSSNSHTGLAPGSEEESVYKIFVRLPQRQKTSQTAQSPGQTFEIKYFF